MSSKYFVSSPHKKSVAFQRFTIKAVCLSSSANFCLPVRQGRLRSIRTLGWKYVHYTSGEAELYDMRADPDELTNLAGAPEYAATESDLRSRLLEFCVRSIDPLG